DKRFAPEVIASVDQTITALVGKNMTPTIDLVGYSGGGAVAVLVAAQRRDVRSIRTIAGNLDHEAVNALHEVSRMAGSLNAIDVAGRVATIPQIHFSGSADDIVPSSVAQRFLERAASPCVRTETVRGASHEEGWHVVWPALLKHAPTCR
ncbi:MAG TPA: alpha/beta hydrolase, partial [Rhodospirillaceae bacterium]|nr:alpha/beta hydrolase [Rhodospirillaceae bacterium]